MRLLLIAPLTLIIDNIPEVKTNSHSFMKLWLKPQLPVFSQQTRLFIITFTKHGLHHLCCFILNFRPCLHAATLQMHFFFF